MPLWIADYRADTAHLGAAEHGAYLLLIMHYWQTGGLPDDDRQLARIACMAPVEWKRAKPVLVKFFDAGWKHGRIEKELAHAEQVSSKRSDAALQMHERRRANASANAQHVQTQSQPPSQSQSDLGSFEGIGKAKCEERPPPRNGQTAPRVGRVYVTKGTPEWEAYAADYRSVHHREPDANKHGGKWFKMMGEGAPVVYRQEKTG
jgi:uncharacterized protein YdaU (DUF1376 family)